jgi:hypothetical protein
VIPAESSRSRANSTPWGRACSGRASEAEGACAVRIAAARWLEQLAPLRASRRGGLIKPVREDLAAARADRRNADHRRPGACQIYGMDGG